MKNNAKEFENSLLLIVSVLILHQLFIYFQLGSDKVYTMEVFAINYLGILSLVIGYFLGFKFAITFSILYVIGFTGLMMYGRYDFLTRHYVWLFLIPIISILSGFLSQSRVRIVQELEEVHIIREELIQLDPETHLMTDNLLQDSLVKHSALAKRYKNYFFSCMMVRFEFIDTIKTRLRKQDFRELFTNVSSIIQSSLRLEDYKFVTKTEKFIMLFPMTTMENLDFVRERIKQNVNELVCIDLNGRQLNVILKIGAIQYSDDQYEYFQNVEQILTMLDKKTEVDIYAEYKN